MPRKQIATKYKNHNAGKELNILGDCVSRLLRIMECVEQRLDGMKVKKGKIITTYAEGERVKNGAVRNEL